MDRVRSDLPVALEQPTVSAVTEASEAVRMYVMTTLAMIAGMLPIALGFGADASFRQPMAIAVIGLLTSTALSLVVVPVVFTCLDRCRLRLVRRMRRNQALIQQSEVIV